MKIRNRNRGVRRVKASSLVPNPRNWRMHAADQRRILKDLLADVGFLGTLLAYELPDGRLQLIDGHLRRETLGDEEVDVAVVDLSPTEAAKVLATFDPLAAMAETDDKRLAALLREVEWQGDAATEWLGMLAAQADLAVRQATRRPAPRLAESWQVLVDCTNESEQRTVYERLAADGLSCRLLTL